MMLTDQAATPSSPSARSSDAPRPRRKWLRRTVYTLLVVLVLLIALVLLLPTLASSGAGRSMLVSAVNGWISGTLAVDDLSLSWFSGQRVGGMILRDPDGQVVADIESIDAPDLSLLKLARGDPAFGQVAVVSREVNIVEEDAQGGTNLGRALGTDDGRKEPAEPEQSQPQEGKGLFGDVKIKLDLKSGKVTYKPWEKESITIRDLVVRLDMPTLAAIDAELKAKIEQAQSAGSIDATAKLTDLFDAAGQFTPARGKINVDAELSQAPTVVLARLLGLDGRLPAVLGPMLDGSLHAAGPLDQLDATLIARSEHLESHVVVVAATDRLYAQEDSVIKLQVVPQSWSELVAGHGTLADSRLVEPFDITLTLSRLTIPRTDAGMNLAAAAVTVKIDVGAVKIDTGRELGEIALHDSVVALESEALGTLIHTTVSTIAQQAERRGELQLTANVTDAVKPDNAFNDTGYSAEVDGRISDFPVVVVDELFGYKGLVVELVGPTLGAQLAAKLAPAGAAGDGGVTGPVSLTADGQNLHVELAAEKQADQVTLREPAKITLTLTPAVVAAARQRYPALAEALGALTLAEPTALDLTVSHLVTPLAAPFDAGKIEFAAAADVAQLALTGDPRLADTQIRQVHIDVPRTRLGAPVDVALTADVVHGQRTATAKVDATVRDLLAQASLAQAKGAISSLPVALIDALAAQDGMLVTLAGDQIDQIDFDVTRPVEAQNTYAFAADITSPRLTGRAEGRYGAAAGLTLDPTTQVQMLITPEAAQALQSRGAQPKQGESVPATDTGAAPGIPGAALTLTEALQLTLNVDEALIVAATPQQAEQGGQLDPTRTRFAVRLTSPGASFTTAGHPQTFTVRDLNVGVVSKDLRQSTRLTALADIGMVDGDSGKTLSGKLDSDTTIAGLADANGRIKAATASYQTRTIIGSLPVAILDVLGQQKGRLVSVLGPMLDEVNLTLQGDPASPQGAAIGATIRSAMLNVKLAGQYGPTGRVALRTVEPASFTVTPASFQALRQWWLTGEEATRRRAREVELAETATFELNVTQLVLTLRDAAEVSAVDHAPVGNAGATATVAAPKSPAQAPAFFDPDRSSMAMKLTIPSLAVLVSQPGSKEKDLLRVDDLIATVTAETLLQPLSLTIEGEMNDADADASAPAPGASTPGAGAGAFTPGAGAGAGRITSRTTVTNLIDPSGRVDIYAADYQTDTQAQAVPTAPLDALFNLQGQLMAMCGNRASLSAVGRLNFAGKPGNMDVNLDSQNATARIAAAIADDVTLREPIVATMKVTPQVAKSLLKWGNPLLIDATESKEPIRLTVHQENFKFPLKLYTTDPDAAMKQAVIEADAELGTITLEDSWLITALVPELRKLGGAIPMDRRQEVTFTTMRARLRNGVVRCDDLWMSSSSMLVGVQGRINLDRAAANMTIGLAGYTLRRIPGVAQLIGDEISESAIFEVPAKGSLANDNLKPKFGPLFVDLAAAIGVKQAGENVGGDIGGLIQLGAGAFKKGLMPKTAKPVDWPNMPKDVLEAAQEQAKPGQNLRPDQPQRPRRRRQQ